MWNEWYSWDMQFLETCNVMKPLNYDDYDKKAPPMNSGAIKKIKFNFVFSINFVP